MNPTINLLRLDLIIKKHWQMLINCVIVGLGVAVILTFVILKPQYQAQTQVVATLPHQSQQTDNDVNNNLQLVNTYKEFVTGDVVLEQTVAHLNQLGVHRTSAQVKKEVKIKQAPNSLMFSIVVTDKDRFAATETANLLAQMFQKNVQRYLNVDKIAIISQAKLPQKPAFPPKVLFLGLGSLLGLLLGLFLSILLELTDQTVKDEQFIKQELALPIMGRVAKISKKQLRLSENQESLLKK